MACNKILNCSRLIIYETDESSEPNLARGYPYWVGGTCFLVEYNNIFFIITAKHVLENQDRNIRNSDSNKIIEQVRIPYHEKSRDFLPLNQCIYINGEKEVYKDIAIFQVASNLLTSNQLPRDTYIRITDINTIIASPLAVYPNKSVIVRGYPFQLNFVNYEQSLIRSRAIIIEGTLSGANGISHIYRLHWLPDHIAAIEHDAEINGGFDPNGLSGSPVFSKDNCEFLGVLIMGSRKIGWFIDRRIIFKAIREYVKNKTAKTK